MKTPSSGSMVVFLKDMSAACKPLSLAHQVTIAVIRHVLVGSLVLRSLSTTHRDKCWPGGRKTRGGVMELAPTESVRGYDRNVSECIARSTILDAMACVTKRVLTGITPVEFMHVIIMSVLRRQIIL